MRHSIERDQHNNMWPQKMTTLVNVKTLYLKIAVSDRIAHHKTLKSEQIKRKKSNELGNFYVKKHSKNLNRYSVNIISLLIKIK